MEAFSRERGPCVALASRNAKPIPIATSVYTRVPAEYRIEHSLDASAAVCRSNLFHAKVRLRGEPRSSSSCRHLPRQLTMKAREFGMRPYLIVVASRSSVECAMHASCVRHAMRIRLLCLAGEVLTSPATPREGSLRSSWEPMKSGSEPPIASVPHNPNKMQQSEGIECCTYPCIHVPVSHIHQYV